MKNKMANMADKLVVSELDQFVHEIEPDLFVYQLDEFDCYLENNYCYSQRFVVVAIANMFAVAIAEDVIAVVVGLEIEIAVVVGLEFADLVADTDFVVVVAVAVDVAVAVANCGPVYQYTGPQLEEVFVRVSDMKWTLPSEDQALERSLLKRQEEEQKSICSPAVDQFVFLKKKIIKNVLHKVIIKIDRIYERYEYVYL